MKFKQKKKEHKPVDHGPLCLCLYHRNERQKGKVNDHKSFKEKESQESN